MTVMSQVSAEKFSDLARVVFPENTIFDPVDYLEVFNLRRDVPLGEATFRKYVSIVSDSKFFPSLRRRRVGKGTYRYVVSSDPGTATSPSLSRAEVEACVADKSLRVFVARMKVFVRKNTWYKPETLRRYYNRGPHRRLKSKTFSYYMSLAFRRGLWEGLSRKKEGKVFRYSWGSKDNVSVTPSVEYTSSPPPEERYLVRGTCGSCGGHSPLEAKFCMHCGAPQGLVVRVALQETFFNVQVGTINPSDEDVLKAVSAAVRERVERMRIRKCDEENGIITYTVSGE